MRDDGSYGHIVAGVRQNLIALLQSVVADIVFYMQCYNARTAGVKKNATTDDAKLQIL
jgi:hypothetical protein